MVDAGPGRGSAVEEPFPLEPPSAARRRGRRPVLGLTSLVVVSLLGYLLVRPDDRDAAQVLSSDPVGEVGLLGITTTGEVVAIDTASAEHRVLLSASETGVEPWPADLPVFDASEDGTMIIGRRDPASGDWDVRRFAPDGEDSVVPAARWPAAEPGGGDRMAWLPDTERPRQVLTGTGADDARAVDLSGALSTPTFDAELRGPLVWVSEEEV